MVMGGGEIAWGSERLAGPRKCSARVENGRRVERRQEEEKLG
jgi:hypothetical protein